METEIIIENEFLEIHRLIFARALSFSFFHF